MQLNWLQMLDADKFLPLLDAASISASKVFQVQTIIVKKQKIMWAYMQPNWMQVLEADKSLNVYLPKTKVNKKWSYYNKNQ